MKVLLVHSGSQSTEQTYADREAHFRELVKYISTDHRPLTLESVSDEQTAYALDGLSTSTETAAVVFASNALLSHHVRMAAEEHRAEIETYISKGGGVLVLHQNIRSDPPEFLPSMYATPTRSAIDGRTKSLSAASPNDIALNFPMSVSLEDLNSPIEGPRDRLFWTSFDSERLPPAMLPVVCGNDPRDVVVLRSTSHGDRGRVALSCLPLDWQGHDGLLRNLLHFIAHGVPERVLWLVGDERNHALYRWLGSHGGTAVISRDLTSIDQGNEAEDDKQAAWLITNTDLLIADALDTPLDKARTAPLISGLIRRGGVALSVTRDPETESTRVRAFVGNGLDLEMGRKLVADLEGSSDWQHEVRRPFDARAMSSALRSLMANESESQRTRDLEEWGKSLADRVYKAEGRDDPGSRLALAHAAILCQQPTSSPAEVKDSISWIWEEQGDDASDLGFQARMLRATVDEVPFAEALFEESEYIARESERATLPTLLRMGAAIVLHRRIVGGDSRTAQPDASKYLDALLTKLSESEPPWLSMNSTADAVIILDSLADLELAPNPELEPVMASGAHCLKRAGRSADGHRHLGMEARITEALVLSDRRFNLGLEQLAAIEWPTGMANGESSEERKDRENLLLALERSRNERDALKGKVKALSTPAAFGRIVTSLLALFLLVVVPVGAISFWLIRGALSIETLVGASALAVIYGYVVARILKELAVRHLLTPHVARIGSLLQRGDE